MPVAKQQHYVPQFYLRNFADDRERIWAYDKFTGKRFQTNIRNVAGANYFYDVPELDRATGKEQFVEQFLQPLEQKTAEVLSALLPKLRTHNFIRLHTDQRNVLAIFIIVQMLRTPELRINVRQGERLMNDFLKQRLSERDIARHFPDAGAGADLATFQASILLDVAAIEQMARIINCHIWTVYKAKPGQCFLTSDNPFAKQPHVKKQLRSSSGIRSRGIEIIFPMSPEFCLGLAERTHFALLEGRDGRLVELQADDNMVYYNYQQIKCSTRFLFSRTENFDFVELVCREEPIWTKPNRKRITSIHDTPGDVIE